MTAFNANAAALQDFLLSDMNHVKRDFVETMSRGRRHFSEFRGVVNDNEGSYRVYRGEPMSQLLEGQSSTNLIWTFPGQGMQLNWDIINQLNQIEIFRTRFDEIMDGLRCRLGDKVFDEKIGVFFPVTGKMNSVSHRPNTIGEQALVSAIELSLSSLWSSYGLQPSGVVGHSVGEIAAAVCAGVHTLDEALDLIVARSVEMERIPQKGFMCQVGADAESLQPLREFDLEIACKNSPYQTVIAGPEREFQSLVNYCEKNSLKHHRLAAVNAFHSELMAPASRALYEKGPILVPKTPEIPIFLTCGAEVVQPFTRDYWSKQMRSCVDFVAAVDRVFDEFEEPIFLEVGLGHALSSFTRAIGGRRDQAAFGVVPGVCHPSNPTAERIADLFAAGYSVPWHTLNKEERGSLVAMPTYRFSRFEVASKTVQMQVPGRHVVPLPPLNERMIGKTPEVSGMNALGPTDSPVLSRVAHVLGVDAASLNLSGSLSDNGVDSLQLIELRLALDELSDSPVPLSLVSDDSSLAEIERRFAAMSDSKFPVTSAFHAKPGNRSKIFFIEGIFGQVGSDAGLRHSVKAKVDVVGLSAPEDENCNDIVAAVRKLADEVERSQPTGPLCLVGHSFGAMLAYSLAGELGDRGREIGWLVAIDGLLAPELSPDHKAHLDDRDFDRLLQKSRRKSKTPAAATSTTDGAVVEKLRLAFYRNCRIADSAQNFSPINYKVTLVLPTKDNVTGINQDVFLQNLREIQEKTGGEVIRDFEVLKVNGDHFSMIRAPAINQLGRLLLSQK
ncbi:acyltransferase domain-containing protein [Rhizobium leguminosarum]|uniref:acyltransferase domain-containing protein n=1 Tax=Rhizobium leguminosarum TaxID=384 RepID=UPI003F97E0F6